MGAGESSGKFSKTNQTNQTTKLSQGPDHRQNR